MGGARNTKIKPHTLEKFRKVRKLLSDEPGMKLKDALERYDLHESTYYGVRRRLAKAT